MAKAIIPEPFSRRKAATYVPEKPCRHGHLLRRVLDKKCVECVAQKNKRRDANPSDERLRYRRDADRRRRKPRGPGFTAEERNIARDDQSAALTILMRTAVYRASTGRSGLTCFAMTGYNGHQLRAHLEKQFLPGMTWQNREDWHIDHIVPIAHFGSYRAGDAAFTACWSLTNLRPCWALQNQKKGPRRSNLL